LAGRASAPCALTAPAPALAHGGGAVFTETNSSANAVQAYAQAADGTLTPGVSYLTRGAVTRAGPAHSGRELPPGRGRQGRRRSGLRGRAGSRSRLAARRQRRLERRVCL